MVYKKSFDSLTIHELYQIMDIRNQVFVLEQKISYVDTDYKDQHATHYFIKEDDQIIAYLRVIDPGYKYEEHAISRVATRKEYRNKGLAQKLIDEVITDLEVFPIRISAQAYLKSYYEKFGFVMTKKAYIEEGIDHVEMLLKRT